MAGAESARIVDRSTPTCNLSSGVGRAPPPKLSEAKDWVLGDNRSGPFSSCRFRPWSLQLLGHGLGSSITLDNEAPIHGMPRSNYRARQLLVTRTSTIRLRGTRDA